jgi:hypothetical protein
VGEIIMQNSKSTKKAIDATLPGIGKVAEGGMPSEGEGVPAGSRYTTTIVERDNKSNNRNMGPERPSANPGMVPTITQGVRKTGRV